jgi:RNA polymerase sigma-70 factor (ECF subfamily)
MNMSEISCDSSQKTPSSATEARKDTALVSEFLAGKESAFIEIMDRHRSKIFHTAMRLLHSHSDAEEVTQDAFIRAYRGLTRFRGECSLSTWLYRIVTNLARNRYWHLFRRRRHATLSLDLALGEDQTFTLADKIAADRADPAQESTRVEFSNLVSECLEKLEPPHREILTLCNVQGLPYDEIATVLGIRLGTVKSRIARARKNLRKHINARCPSLAEAINPDDYFLPATNFSSIHMAA